MLKTFRFVLHVGMISALLSLVACDDDKTTDVPINHAPDTSMAQPASK